MLAVRIFPQSLNVLPVDDARSENFPSVFKCVLPVVDARSENFPSILGAESPAIPFSNIKPLGEKFNLKRSTYTLNESVL